MPVVSEAQRRAMYSASEGHSTLGIPKSVGKEFITASHGLTHLPEHAHDDHERTRVFHHVLAHALTGR